MLSHEACVGGIIIIKNNDKHIAWVDIFGDLLFSDNIDLENQERIKEYLEKNGIMFDNIL